MSVPAVARRSHLASELADWRAGSCRQGGCGPCSRRGCVFVRRWQRRVRGGERASWLTGYGTAQRVRGLLEQERWIGTGFYAHVRVTRVNDGTVRLRVRPHARPGRFVTVWISWSCLPGEGAGCG